MSFVAGRGTGAAIFARARSPRSREHRSAASVEPIDITLNLLAGTFSVARLDPGAAVPAWATGGDLVSITRTPTELSIVCPDEHVPASVQRESGFRALIVAQVLDFALTGILSGISAPLAAAGISIFVLSTFDADIVLVREADLPAAVAALRESGYGVAGL